MEERLIAFVIWAIMGVLFIAMGIYDLNSKKAKPFGFWANAEVAPIEDAKGYNRALGILWCVYGVLWVLISKISAISFKRSCLGTLASDSYCAIRTSEVLPRKLRTSPSC